MRQVIPLYKQRKKAQREYYAKQRESWYGISPVTRTVPSRKTYDRNRIKRETQGDWAGTMQCVALSTKPAHWQSIPASDAHQEKRWPSANRDPALCATRRICGLGLWWANITSQRKVYQVSEEQSLSAMDQASRMDHFKSGCHLKMSLKDWSMKGL